MSVVYPRVILPNVRVTFPITCGVCGHQEQVDRQVDLDLTSVTGGSHFDSSLRQVAAKAAWPEGWTSESYWYDESGGPGGQGERAVCPACQEKRQTGSC